MPLIMKLELLFCRNKNSNERPWVNHSKTIACIFSQTQAYWFIQITKTYSQSRASQNQAPYTYQLSVRDSKVWANVLGFSRPRAAALCSIFLRQRALTDGARSFENKHFNYLSTRLQLNVQNCERNNSNKQKDFVLTWWNDYFFWQ
jgi:hypothetical protein